MSVKRYSRSDRTLMCPADEHADWTAERLADQVVESQVDACLGARVAPVVDECEEVLAVERVLADELRAKAVLYRSLHLFLSLAEEAAVGLSLSDPPPSVTRLPRHEEVIVDAGRRLWREPAPHVLRSAAFSAVRRVGNVN